tara:strand:- start:80 stop:511 length:432 start_codon:yes stop_codon:yes gene_type:complete
LSQFKRPESVLVLIYSLQNEVLLLERKNPPNLWQSVTGSLRWGETAHQAAYREVYEETGIRANREIINVRHRERYRILPPWKHRYSKNTKYNTEHWFLLRLKARRLIKLNPDEHIKYRWISSRQAKYLTFSSTNAKAIKYFCQ